MTQYFQLAFLRTQQWDGRYHDPAPSLCSTPHAPATPPTLSAPTDAVVQRGACPALGLLTVLLRTESSRDRVRWVPASQGWAAARLARPATATPAPGSCHSAPGGPGAAAGGGPVSGDPHCKASTPRWHNGGACVRRPCCSTAPHSAAAVVYCMFDDEGWACLRCSGLVNADEPGHNVMPQPMLACSTPPNAP